MDSLNDRQKKVMTCIMNCWINSGMRLYPELQYKEVTELMTKLDVKHPKKMLEEYGDKYGEGFVDQ